MGIEYRRRVAVDLLKVGRGHGPGGDRGEPEIPPNILLTLSPGRRGGATAQSALGWYRPSVGVPETLVALNLDLGYLLVIVMVLVFFLIALLYLYSRVYWRTKQECGVKWSCAADVISLIS